VTKIQQSRLDQAYHLGENLGAQGNGRVVRGVVMRLDELFPP
jgi:hypothetical protein